VPIVLSDILLPFAAGEPAGGSPIDQVIIATVGATAATALLLWLVIGHRWGRVNVLRRVGAFAERVSGLPAWAAVPSVVVTVSLLTALLGMYWDISLHIDDGRDAGPLANPGHYLILAGLFGMFAAGLLAMAMPEERPGRAAVRISEGWYAPVGGVLIAACGVFSLVAFPLDDIWHRIFGQDVTLWGPTHLMLIGGAGMSLVGQGILLAEAMQYRRERTGSGSPPATEVGGLKVSPAAITSLRRMGVMGGFLIGLSTFQAEFDFGVPQYDQAFQPMFIALAAGIALVCARLWIGAGGALIAVAFFLVVRGIVALLVGPVWGETTPAMPLYLGEAACVELAALALARRPLVLGAVSGLLIGTVGFATEWAWTHLVFRLPWNDALLPDGLIVAVIAGVTGGLVGALLGLGLRGELPRPALARGIFASSLAVTAGLIVWGLSTTVPADTSATVTMTPVPGSEGGTAGEAGGQANATVRFHPPTFPDDARWANVTAWQGKDRLRIAELRKVGDGVFRTTEAVPVDGSWKTLLRVHRGGEVVAIPIYLPGDSAIPAPEIPAKPQFTRTFVADQKILQRERKDDTPGWLWAAAVAFVMTMYVVFLSALAWGVGRVARRDPRRPKPEGPPKAPAEPRVVATPSPAGG
jgi:hypothetical protein